MVLKNYRTLYTYICLAVPRLLIQIDVLMMEAGMLILFEFTFLFNHLSLNLPALENLIL